MSPQSQQLASGAFSEFLQPYNAGQFQDLFQRSVVDPAQQTLQRHLIPSIKESFLGAGESGSGALNRALAQSATDLSTALGSQMMGFYQQQQGDKMRALGLLGGLAGQRTFEPMVEQTQGILGPLISALGQIGTAALM